GWHATVFLGERLLDRVRQGVRLVARVDQPAALLVLVRVTLGFLHQPIHFLLAEPARCGDRDLLFLPRREILGGDVDDAIGVDVEGHLDLRDATRAGRYADQVKAAERAVVAGQRTLALQHVHVDARLVIGGRREDFAFLRGNRGVPWDQR